MTTPSRRPAALGLLLGALLLPLSLLAAVAPSSTATPAPASTVGAATALAPQTSTTQRAAYTRSQRLTRVDSLMRGSLATFLKAKAASKSGIDATFNWGDDGCSAPAGGGGYNSVFLNACKRHDFGYRNLGWGYYTSKNLALASTPGAKDAVDKIFLADMRARCGSSSQCLTAAAAYYAAIRKAGAAQTAFYKGECQPGYLCLFDDAGYQDRRVRLTASVSNLNSVSFGDKTSSVKNTSSVSWTLFDDDGYRDTAKCFSSGSSNSNVGGLGFNDKASAARRNSGSSC